MWVFCAFQKGKGKRGREGYSFFYLVYFFPVMAVAVFVKVSCDGAMLAYLELDIHG